MYAPDVIPSQHSVLYYPDISLILPHSNLSQIFLKQRKETEAVKKLEILYNGGIPNIKERIKKLCLLTPTNLHPVEDGYDEGALMLLTAADNINLAFWSSIIQNIQHIALIGPP